MALDISTAAVTAAANTTKETINAQIITSTLDTLNKTSTGTGKKSGGTSDMAASYDFQKSVLSAVYCPTGGITNVSS